ncbi:MAG: SusC/RagA family TonB-linked outer membrane protein [Candidatus Cloacimonetes bacterium]|jgi:TonB-linked SusC/RagA family outer membrane protein|nr:SusC/RagA family TonB-linked outer membrane protein [Candidatus Cloacimonadota bacterium]
MNRRNRAGAGLLRFVAGTALALGVAWPAQAQMPAQVSMAPESLLDRPARIEVANVALSQALLELQRHSGVPLIYSPSLLESEGPITCECGNLTVRQALERMLTGTRFRYEDVGAQILIERRAERIGGPVATTASLAGGTVAPAPIARASAVHAEASLWSKLAGGIGAMFTRGAPGTIVGRVIDEATQEPLASVQVYVVGTALNALTDGNGSYVINGVPAGLYTVEAQRIGYANATRENVSVPDGGTVTVNFEMSVTALTLDEIVATGVVDPTSARRVPFTVARVSGDALQVPVDNAVNSLQGKVAGANIVTSPQPGAGVNIVLRSPTSITKSNSPLIVVDGVILATTFGRSSADIDALDIESIEVVKGAAAASLYGSRAANGVIQIRTRRGTNLEEGQTRVTVRSEFGRSSIAGDMPRARHHHYLMNEAGQYVDQNGNVVSREERVERPASERFLDQPYSVPTYDHVDQFFHPGGYSTNSISIAQNGATTNFFASYTRRDTEGVIQAHGGFKMDDVRLNFDHRLRSDLSFSMSAYHSRSERDNLPDNTFLNLIQTAPDSDLLQPDPDGTPFIFQPDPIGATSNPLYELAVQEDIEERARTLASADLRYSPTGWLSIDGNLSYDRSDRHTFFYFPRGKKTNQQTLVGGSVQRGSGETTAINGSVSANLRRSFGDLATRLTLRALMESEDYTYFQSVASSLQADGVPDLDAGSVPSIGGNTEEIRSEGYFAILGLDYAGRYIVDALVRRDGSSLFGPDERWHTYYRGSFAWRMAEESWWPLEPVTEFKLRYSIGTAGGRPDYLNQYETYAFSAGGRLTKGALGNRELKPERATEQEFGIDAVLYDRVSLQLNYARVKTEDQLLQIPLPAAFGFSSQWQNAGTVEGQTWEATIEAAVLQRPDLRWTVGLVADHSKHKITKFDRPCYRAGGSNQLFRCEGEALSTMFGGHFLRSVDELPAGAPRDEFMVNDDGLLVWVGQGGDWRNHQWGTSATFDGTTYGWGLPILQYDETGNTAIVRIGDGNPDLNLGLSSSLTWKGLTFYTLFGSQIGGHVYNRTNQRMYQYFRSGDTDQAGKPQELKKTTDYYTALYAANVINDWFIEDATYVKLREASLRWTVPSSLLESVRLGRIDGLSMFLIGRNLLTFSDYKGFDPEIGTPIARIDSFDYPQYRTVTAGVEIRF